MSEKMSKHDYCRTSYGESRRDFAAPNIPKLSSHPWLNKMTKPSTMVHEIRLDRGEVLYEGTCCCVWAAKELALTELKQRRLK